MAEAPLVFQQAFVALRRVLAPHWSETLSQRYVALGVNLNAPEPAYPLSTWVQALDLAMATISPGVDHDKATRDIGQRMVQATSETVLGGAMFALLRVLGPKRGLMRMARNLRSSNNYSESEVRETAPGQYELTLNLVNYPHYYVGMLETGLTLMGAKATEVSVVDRLPNQQTRFRIQFS